MENKQIKRLNDNGSMKVCRFDKWDMEYSAETQSYVNDKIALHDVSIMRTSDYVDLELKSGNWIAELDRATDILVINECCSGDYVGLGILGRSNYRSLLAMLEYNAEQNAELAIGTAYWKIEDGYGYQSLAVSLDYPKTDVNDIPAILESLTDYPIIDEEDYSELQFEEQHIQFLDWIVKDFVTELETRHEGYSLEDVPAEELEYLFNSYEPEYIDEQNSIWVDVDNIAEQVTEHDIQKLTNLKLSEDVTEELRQKLQYLILEVQGQQTLDLAV